MPVRMHAENKIILLRQAISDFFHCFLMNIYISFYSYFPEWISFVMSSKRNDVRSATRSIDLVWPSTAL